MTDRQDLDGLVMSLTRALAQRQLHDGDHPKVKALAESVAGQLAAFLDRTGKDDLRLDVVEGHVLHDGRHLVGPSIAGGQLIQLARKWHSGGLVLGRQATAEDVLALLAAAADRRAAPADLAEARARLAGHGVARIELADVETDEAAAEVAAMAWHDGAEDESQPPAPIAVFQTLFDVVTAAHGAAQQGHALRLDAARAASEALVRCAQATFMDVARLVQYADHDTYTVGHSVRVATLAVHVAGRLGLPADRLIDLGSAALLHDVGKSRIPDEILHKPSRPDRREIAIIRSHALQGAEILLAEKGATPLEIAAAYGHHLRHDGGGYPEQPAWAVRHPLTALIQICDVFEALTAARPYRAPVSTRAAIEIMVADTGAFTPALLAGFIRAVGYGRPARSRRPRRAQTPAVV